MADDSSGPPRPAPKRYDDQPTGAVPVERKPGSMPPGLRNALIVIAAVIVAATASALFGFFVLADKADKSDDEALGSTDCAYISDADLTEAVGEPVDAFQLGSVNAIPAQTSDAGVQVDGVPCLASGTGTDLSVSIVVSTDGDAEQTFTAEKEQAEAPEAGTNPYLQGVVPGLGDEAFCTTADPFGYSGVLVRDGDRLVYASVVPSDPAATAEARCDLAKQVARALI